MPFLLLFAIPVIEIYLAIQVGEEIGFFNAIILMCGAALVGFGLLNITGRTFLLELQTRAVKGEPLEKVLLSQALRFVAGLLFIIPGFVTDVIAIFALLASLMPSLFAKPINRNVKQWNSNFKVYTQQSGPQTGSHPSPFGRRTRDVTPGDPEVIDVLPEKPSSQD